MKFIKIFFQFVFLETFAYLAVNINRFLSRREKDVLLGRNNLVIFVEGYGGNWPDQGYSKYISSRDDFDAIFVDYKSSKATSVFQYAKIIDKTYQVYKDNYSQIVLVGFSLGGIACLYYLENYKTKVNKLITVSTPFNGSVFSKINSLDKIASVMHPENKILKEVSRYKPRAQVIAVMSVFDQISLFHKNNPPKYAKKVKIDAVGHNNSMRAVNTSKVLDKYL